MGTKTNITEEMQLALDIIKEHGSIVRYKGGFWARPAAEMALSKGGPPSQWYFYPTGTWIHAGTLKGLAKRGLIEVADQAIGASGPFPVKYVLKPIRANSNQ